MNLRRRLDRLQRAEPYLVRDDSPLAVLLGALQESLAQTGGRSVQPEKGAAHVPLSVLREEIREALARDEARNP